MRVASRVPRKSSMRVWGLIGFRIWGFRVSGSKPKVWGKGVGTKLGALLVRIRFGDILYYISIIRNPQYWCW